MKYIAILALLTLAAPAAAEEAKPAPKVNSCGKTADECQKVVDDLTTAVGVLQQQRDANGKAAGDAQVNLVVLQQKLTPPAASPPPK